MANDNETVREVCAEMDDRDCECGNGWLNHYSTRVIAAYERDEVSHMAYVARECAKVKVECDRELAAKDAEIKRLNGELCHADGLMNTMSLEIARLKAALKPVMECKTKSAEGSMPNYMGCWDAIREAQRVMREGGAE